ncbi:MAG: FAD-binding protein [Pseudomonadota bacterium]|nr:FAD-binding protein [Pseudomonadota bacterium]
MRTLVIAEHNNAEIKPATLNVITAGKKLGEVSVLVAGSDCRGIAETVASLVGVHKVLIADNPALANGAAENLAPMIVKISDEFTHLLAPATTFGKNLMPRIAALLDLAQISEITEIIDSETFVRPIYAGNALATVKSSDKIKVITVRSTAFEETISKEELSIIEEITDVEESGLSKFVSQELTKSERPELTNANIVISGGRGMQSGDNFHLLESIADKLGAAVGASRAAVDAGFVPNDYQVGQTGKVVAPDLYIAVGISGAIQHLAGMKDSKVIVAINKDEDAPIFKVADYGLAEDLFEALPAILSELNK